MEIKEFSFKNCLPQLRELFKTHWEEVASNKHSRNLNIDEDMFILLEENKILLSIGAFNEDILIGYSINIISKDTHYCTKILCGNDAL